MASSPEKAQKCISCHRKVANSEATTMFRCPKCQGYEIVRCGNCRKNAVAYVCPSCNFRGPN